MFTIKARRFIGILEINGIDYLTYHISEKHDKRYINSVIYDIQKEKKYKNIIMLIIWEKKITKRKKIIMYRGKIKYDNTNC